MFKKLSSTALWIAIVMIFVAAQAYSAFGQNELVGTWKNGSVGMIQYQNRTTGATKPGRGSIFNYKFNANGTYEFIGYMETTMYNCTTTLFNQINGRYKVKHPDMKPLYLDAMERLRGFGRWRVKSVPRAQNAAADALVNQALDAAK